MCCTGPWWASTYIFFFSSILRNYSRYIHAFILELWDIYWRVLTLEKLSFLAYLLRTLIYLFFLSSPTTSAEFPNKTSYYFNVLLLLKFFFFWREGERFECPG